jgi:hypothetical protein
MAMTYWNKWTSRYDKPPHVIEAEKEIARRKNGKTAQAKPVDWGPNERTGRVADLSPGLARFVGLEAMMWLRSLWPNPD